MCLVTRVNTGKIEGPLQEKQNGQVDRTSGLCSVNANLQHAHCLLSTLNSLVQWWRSLIPDVGKQMGDVLTGHPAAQEGSQQPSDKPPVQEVRVDQGRELRK